MKNPASLYVTIVLLSAGISFAQPSYRTATDEVRISIGSDTLQNAWVGGVNSATLATFDFNFDGLDDVLLLDRQHDRGLVFLSQNGQHVFSSAISQNLPSLRRYALFYDYDYDGRKDLFTATQLGIKAYRNISNGNSLAFSAVAEPINTYYAPSYSNMDISTLDVPSLADVDNDGDMDILYFKYSNGISVIWERNMSKEKYNKPDSLDFKQTDDCWGGFQEQLCTTYYFGYDCQNNFRQEHVGAGAVLALDIDNDGDKDLLVGKEDCLNLNYLENKGTASAAFFNKLTPDFPAVNPIQPLPYPLSFYEDVDFDGNKDLIATMGLNYLPTNTDLAKSIWWYKNTGTNTLPVFTFMSKGLLQNTMIDLGQNTHPAFADINGDGDLDMFIGNSTNITGKGASIFYFENIGTIAKPSFALRDTNYLDQASSVFDELSLSFTDLNNDNRNDLILVSQKGTAFTSQIFLNQSDLGLNFSISAILNIPLTDASSLCFHDLDKDNLKDVLVGNAAGNLLYFKNTGTSSAPSFTLVTNSYGGIGPNTGSTNTNLSITIADIDFDGKADLLIADDDGLLKLYPDFENQSSPFLGQLLSNTGTAIYPIGKKISVSCADLNGDSKHEIILGNDNGGLQILMPYENPNGLADDMRNQTQEIIVFPNPNDGSFEIQVTEAGKLEIRDAMGQVCYKNAIENAQTIKIDLQLAKGIYFVSFGTRKTKKLVINH